MDECPHCGAADPEAGALMVRGSANQDIRFRPDAAGVFAFKDHVRAVACRSCGRITLLLASVGRPPANDGPPDADPGPADGGA